MSEFSVVTHFERDARTPKRRWVAWILNADQPDVIVEQASGFRFKLTAWWWSRRYLRHFGAYRVWPANSQEKAP